MHIDDHAEANRGKNKGQISPDQIVDFWKLFRKITKKLGFHLTFETTDLQDIIYTTCADANNVKTNYFYPYVPIFIPSAETQAMFNESIKYNYTNWVSFDSWCTGRKVVSDELEFQVDIGSAQDINSPKYLVVAH